MRRTILLLAIVMTGLSACGNANRYDPQSCDSYTYHFRAVGPDNAMHEMCSDMEEQEYNAAMAYDNFVAPKEPWRRHVWHGIPAEGFPAHD